MHNFMRTHCIVHVPLELRIVDVPFRILPSYNLLIVISQAINKSSQTDVGRGKVREEAEVYRVET